MINSENNPIVEKVLKFSLDLISFCEELEKQRKFIIANQLLRSGTSIGANVLEAQNPHSRMILFQK